MVITENKLRATIKESISKHLNEIFDSPEGAEFAGKLMASIDYGKYDKDKKRGYDPKELRNDVLLRAFDESDKDPKKGLDNHIYNGYRSVTKESVSRIVGQVLKEGLFDGGMDESMFDETMFAEKKKKHHSKPEHNDEKKSGSKDASKRRQRVISYLKQDGVDVAQYAYELWPDKDEDSGRSYFYKCLDGEKNDSGVPYRFNDDEVNRLYSMISSNSI